MGVIEYNKKNYRIRAKQTLRNQTKKTIKALIITLTSMIVVLTAVFLSLTTKAAENGYTLEQAKLINEKLKNENDSIKARLTEVTAFSKLDQQKKVTEMQPLEVDKKVYVTKEDNQVK